MMDQNDVDEKIIAISFGDPSLNCYRDIKELPAHLFEEISHFFTVYKQLEGKKTFVTEILGREAAEAIISESLKAYKVRFQTKLMNLDQSHHS